MSSSAKIVGKSNQSKNIITYSIIALVFLIFSDSKRRFLLNLKVNVLLPIFFTVSIKKKKNTF